jgi:hypothetical protein
MILTRYQLRTVADTRIDRLTRGNILHPKAGLPMTIERAGTPASPPQPVTGNIGELIEVVLP